MKNRSLVFVLTLATALSAGTQLSAQSNSADAADRNEGSSPLQNDQRVTGTVLETDGNRLVVKLENGQQMTFVVTGDSENVGSYRVGDRVTASYVSLAGTGAVVKRLTSAETTTSTKTTTTTYVPPAEPVRTTTVEPVRPAPVTPPPAPANTYPPATATTYPAATAPANDDAALSTLPATASELPLIALLGLGAVGGALIVRKFSLS
jgi:hypothetical protein